eukprot:scaffold113750_cov26-Tisochrysis_lutea.AAC.3
MPLSPTECRRTLAVELTRERGDSLELSCGTLDHATEGQPSHTATGPRGSAGRESGGPASLQQRTTCVGGEYDAGARLDRRGGNPFVQRTTRGLLDRTPPPPPPVVARSGRREGGEGGEREGWSLWRRDGERHGLGTLHTAPLVSAASRIRLPPLPLTALPSGQMVQARLTLNGQAAVQLHLLAASGQVASRVRCTHDALKPLLAVDAFCRHLALAVRMGTSIAAGRKVRQHTQESCVETLVEATNDLMRGIERHRELQRLATSPSKELRCHKLSLDDAMEDFCLHPIGEIVRLLCLVRVRAAPMIPWELWEGIIVEVLARDAPANKRHHSLFSGGLGARPPRNLVLAFGYDGVTQEFRVKLAAIEHVPNLREKEIAALGALLTVQDLQEVCGLAALCSQPSLWDRTLMDG